MSAAVEGAMENIPSIGFSLLSHSIDANFEASKIFAQKIIKEVLNKGIEDYTCLNVNIPNIEYDLIMGVKICRQASGNWQEEYEERTDPMGRKYYWLTGNFIINDGAKDTDVWALDNNFVSVVPVQFDITNHKAINKLKFLENV